jgi:hypothetical protein
VKKSVLRIVALLMVAIVACAALASCGKKLSGEYYMGDKTITKSYTQYTFSGSKVTVDTYLLGNKVGLEASENDNVTNTGSGDATAEGGLSVTLSANCVASALPLAKTAIEAVSGTVVEEGE